MTWRPASRRRAAGVRRRGGRSYGMLLAVVSVVLASVGVGAEPAMADEHYPEPPDDCVLHTEDWESSWYQNNAYNVFTSGESYLQCLDEQAGCRVLDEVQEGADYGPRSDFADGTYFCPLDPEIQEFVECRNDVRFRFLGPFAEGSWRPSDFNPMPGDPETGWFAEDMTGLVLVPNDAPPWWVNEFHAENILAHDRDHEGGQGCEVGASYPQHLSCEEVNQRIDDLRPDAERYEQWEQSDGQSRDDIGNNRDIGALRQASAELRDLETVGGLIPDDCWGTYPLDRYQISWKSGGDEDDLQNSNRLLGFLAKLLFGLAKTLVGIMLWLIRLAFTFNVNDYRAAVGDFAQRIDQNLVHLGSDNPLTLFDVAWFALFAYAGFQALRGRAGRAVGEIAMAVLLAGLGVVLIGNFFPGGGGGSFRDTASSGQSASDVGGFRSTASPDEAAYTDGGYFDSVGDLLNLSALGLLNVANGDDPNVSADVLDDPQAVRELIRETNERLHHEFIERPYWFINYNRERFDEGDGDAAESVAGTGTPHLLPDAGDDRNFSGGYEFPPNWEYEPISCNDVANHLQSLPETEGDWTERFMERNGCHEMAEWNGEMNVERLMMTVLVTAVAVVVTVGVGLAAVTLLLAKFLVAVLFVALPLAVVLAVLPGQSRALAWGWLTSLLQLWLVALGMGLVLVTVLLGVDAIHATTSGRSLAERWLMILLLVATVYLLRKRMTAGAQGLASSLQERLSASTGEQAWAGGSGKRQRLNELDLAGVDRGAARAGMAGRVMALTGTAMAARTGARTVASVNHNTLGGIRRSAVAEYGRRRSAKLGQPWHLRNTDFMEKFKRAKETVAGDRPTRDRKLEDSDAAHEYNDVKRENRKATWIAARVATKDYLDIKDHKKDFRPGAAKTLAAKRLGIDTAAWNADPAGRHEMVEQAKNQMQRAQEAAGFNPRRHSKKELKRDMAVAKREQSILNSKPGSSRRAYDKWQRDRQSAEEDKRRAYSEYGERLKVEYLTWDEAQAITGSMKE